MAHSRRLAAARIGAVAGFISLCAALLSPRAMAESTADIEPRILAQEGLAIALASNVLQSQLQVLTNSGSTGNGCVKLKGGGSVQTISVTPVSSNVKDAKVTVYFDTACQSPYIEASATLTGSADVISISETATYFGLQGQTLGSLSLSESATSSKKNLILIGLGKFTPQSGAQTVDLGLTCTLPNSAPATTAHCAGGVAQDFPALDLSLASVTPLTLTEEKTGKIESVNFAGKASDMQTGAAGSLSITTLTGSSLGIGGGGSVYASAATKGHAARFVLFPPTPTHWTVVDKTHDARFSLQVASKTTRDSKAMVTDISSGGVLATIAVDQSGTGTISYADGTRDAVTSWLLAD